MPLISSAAAGKKSAPKAPARRRQAAVAQAAAESAATAVASLEESNSTTANTAPLSPPSLPPTQNEPDSQTQPVATTISVDQPETVEPPAAHDRIEQDSNVPTVNRVESNEASGTSPIPDALPHHVQSTPVEQPILPLDPRLASLPTPAATQESERRSSAQIFSTPEQDRQSDRVDVTRDENLSNDGIEQAQAEIVGRASPSIQEDGQGRPPNVEEPTAAPTVAKRKPVPTSTVASPRPAKRTKNNSTRSNNVVQAAQDNGADSDPATLVTSQSADVTADQRQAQTQEKPKVRRRTTETATAGKRKRDSTRSTVPVDATEDHDAGEGSSQPVQRKRKKRQTPLEANNTAEGESPDEDPEQHEIDPSALSMFALSHDTVHGKTSEREKKMAAIDWTEVAQKRRDEACRIAAGHQDADGGDAIPSIESAKGSTDERPAAKSNQSGTVQFTIDAAGNIVADETSLHINRQEAFEAAEARGGPVEDVNDLTVRINRTTWVNDSRRDPTDRVPVWKSKSDPWSEEETDRFYDALRMFGTDFDIISKMFPGKTRKHVKLKFTREERLDPVRLNNVLLGKETRTMNLEHYAKETGNDVSVYTKYDGVAHALSLINASMKDQQMALTAGGDEGALVEGERTEKEKQAAVEKKPSTKKARKKRGTTTEGTVGGAAEGEE